MAQAQVIYTNAAGGANPAGSLFQGTKFWFAQRVPLRSHIMEQVKSNGGGVVPLEKQADIRIVDHKRRDNLPGTHSFEYITLSIRNGQLENLDDHLAGPPEGLMRSVGSVTIPSKGGRRLFTTEDDRVLYDWVTSHERRGGKILGNEIYKQLEAQNSRHPWQSWRDRWVKQLSSRPPPAPVPSNAPPTPPLDQSGDVMGQTSSISLPQRDDGHRERRNFTAEEAKKLLAIAKDIINIHEERVDEAWETWANESPEHTALEWRNFFHERVLPIYKDQLKRTADDRSRSVPKDSDQQTKARTPIKTESGRHDIVKESHKPQIRSSTLELPAKSPSLEPESPRIQVQIWSKNHNGAVAEQDKIHDKETRSSEAEEVTPTPKRKRLAAKEEPASSPPILSTPHRFMRQRLQTSTHHEREIPSTPEDVRLSLPVSSPSRALFVTDNEDSEEEEEEEEEEGIAHNLGLPASQTLSEPDHHAQETQALFQNPSQDFDFDLPPPKGGWDDGDDNNDGNDLRSPSHNKKIPAQPPTTQAKDTQSLLTAPAQIPDFSLPDPDGGWDTLLPSSPRTTAPQSSLPSALAPTPQQQLTEDITTQLDTWIDTHIARGHSEDDVLLSLKCTSMATLLASAVLQSLAAGEGVPRDMRGVWTEEEDAWVEGGDGRRIEALERRHGKEAFDARCRFLMEYRGC
ncbi:MAG: hypothetical protein M1827_007726 [Pycnora praestabilis]|nr:MAG: hypothetical protein M1827_007726 [Pycnora praestabilis]